jgi:hypothetical protein
VLRRVARKAWRGATQPRRTYREAIILADLVRYRSRTRPFREAQPQSPTNGTALIVSLSDFVYQVKLESMFGTALRLHGLKPVVLTDRLNRWAEPYFRSVGMTDFVHLDSMVTAATEQEVEHAATAFLAGDVSVQSLKALEFHGAHVGEQTLASLSRGFERGRLSLADPEVHDALGLLLRDSMRSVLGAEEVLEQVAPDLVVFNEKGYAGFGSVYDVALSRGANVIQFVAAGIHWRDAVLLKRFTDETRRAHPASLSPPTWEQVRGMPWTAEREQELRAEFDLRYGEGEKHPDAGLQDGKRIMAADEVRSRLGLDPQQKTAVLFSHVLWDANLFYGEDLFEDQETWLVETVRAACANPAVNWVVKLHPANLYKAETGRLNDEDAIREAVGELPPHVQLLRPETEINTYSLFGLTDYGITIRGTIGMELPCFGVRVLTAGTGRYSGLGFTDDSRSADEYLDKLMRLQDLPPLGADETLLAKRHAYALFRLRPFRFTSFQAHFMPPARLKHPLSHNLYPLARTSGDVELAPDLRGFADWALDRDQLDYLSPPS